jgi:hypothetical protein
MSGIKDHDRIEALRKRLYERGNPLVHTERHQLTDIKEDVHTQWEAPPQPVEEKVLPERVEEPASETYNDVDMSPKKQKRGYRLKVLLAGIIFFILAVSISSGILIWGNSPISGKNISIEVTGPFTIGGGDTLPLQVGITNSNTVPIESAVLIVEYPLGTLSATEEQKELFTERLVLETVGSGETINVPLRAVVFGEENDEQNVEVSIEYRIQGSNALFFKEADPLRYKISSSPIIVKAQALQKVSSGQETEVVLTVTSNSPTTLSEILVQAEYPLGFDFTSSEPSPVSAQNIWLIKNLEPEASETITIKGIVVGKEMDEYAINFTAGVPGESNPHSLASIFAATQTEFEIEQPFLDIALEIAGVVNGEVVIEPGHHSGATIKVQNTLEDTIYDLVVEVQLGGNALSDFKVGPPSGFYDSTNNKIIWDISSAPELSELHPGEKIQLSFGIEPSEDAQRTPQITFDVNVKARRVSETQVTETLLGTASSIMKVASAPQLRADVGFNNGMFSDAGPIPPAAEKETTYTISFMVENGTNEISDTSITAVLPSYVTWKEQSSGAGSMSYDAARRLVTWEAGSVDANAAAFGSFQIAFVPSKSQIGDRPILVGEQRLKATDRFTGTVVRDVNLPIKTEMSTETGQPKDNGKVVE